MANSPLSAQNLVPAAGKCHCAGSLYSCLLFLFCLFAPPSTPSLAAVSGPGASVCTAHTCLHAHSPGFCLTRPRPGQRSGFWMVIAPSFPGLVQPAAPPGLHQSAACLAFGDKSTCAPDRLSGVLHTPLSFSAWAAAHTCAQSTVPSCPGGAPDPVCLRGRICQDIGNESERD